MLFGDHLVVLRGGGDLATGVALRLHRAGFPLVVLELDQPLAIRRTVALASAVFEGRVVVEGMEAVRVDSPGEAETLASSEMVPVLAASTLPEFPSPPAVVVDARVAKRNLDTTIDQAPLVVALGPGFEAGIDCHAVVETKRGHRLGRVVWEGSAAPDTGVPGRVGGSDTDRVVRAPTGGVVAWKVEIADRIEKDHEMGRVEDTPVTAPIAGVVRGLIAPGRRVAPGLKIADIDPRGDASACFEVSDKARLVGGGVLEAVLVWLNLFRQTNSDPSPPPRVTGGLGPAGLGPS